MTKVLTGTIDPFDGDYQPPLSVTLQSVDTASSFLELDVYTTRNQKTGLLSAALWHDLGMAEGWMTPDIHRRGAATFVCGAFGLRYVTGTTVRFYGEWHRDSNGEHCCVRAEASAVSLGAATRSYERFGLVLER